jgi:hypothetical protein
MLFTENEPWEKKTRPGVNGSISCSHRTIKWGNLILSFFPNFLLGIWLDLAPPAPNNWRVQISNSFNEEHINLHATTCQILKDKKLNQQSRLTLGNQYTSRHINMQISNNVNRKSTSVSINCHQPTSNPANVKYNMPIKTTPITSTNNQNKFINIINQHIRCTYQNHSTTNECQAWIEKKHCPRSVDPKDPTFTNPLVMKNHLLWREMPFKNAGLHTLKTVIFYSQCWGEPRAC